MNWIFQLLPDSWLETLARKLLGGFVAKWVGMAAASLVVHGFMRSEAATQWQQTTAEAILGVLLAGLSHWLTLLRDRAKTSDIATATATPVGTPVQLPPASQAILAPTPSDMGRTAIGKTALALALSVFSLQSSVFGQAPVVTPPPPAPAAQTVSDVLYTGAAQGGQFIWSKGELCGGAGGTFDQLAKGQCAPVTAAMFNLTATNALVHVGPAASVLTANDRTHVGLGVAASVPLHHFKGLESTQLGPMQKWADWRVGAGATVDADRACQGQFSQATATGWFFASKPF